MNTAATVTTWDVWTLDVWGNAADGWDVNDRSKVGTIEAPADADDSAIVDALIGAGFLAPYARGRVELDGDDTMIRVDAPSGMPLLDVWRRP